MEYRYGGAGDIRGPGCWSSGPCTIIHPTRNVGCILFEYIRVLGLPLSIIPSHIRSSPPLLSSSPPRSSSARPTRTIQDDYTQRCAPRLCPISLLTTVCSTVYASPTSAPKSRLPYVWAPRQRDVRRGKPPDPACAQADSCTPADTHRGRRGGVVVATCWDASTATRRTERRRRNG